MLYQTCVNILLHQAVTQSRSGCNSDGQVHEEISAIVAVSPAYYVNETTKIRQPIPPKRVPKRSRFLDSSEYAVDPKLRALFQSRKKKPAYSPLPEVDESEFETFKALLENYPDQYVISASFLRNLYC